MTDLAASLAPGLLADVHATGALGFGDVHVAQKASFLYGESDQRVQLALALAVRALREGSTCVELNQIEAARFETDAEAFAQIPAGIWPEADAWRAAVEASPLVRRGADGPGDRPLRLVGDRLYLERYWQEETTVATELTARRGAPTAPPSPQSLLTAASGLLDGDDVDQAVAAIVPLYTGVCVIAGGPGTGKTYTLARLLGMLVRTSEQPLSIALAAPTGKAAVRMEESMAKALASMPDDLAATLGALRAGTVHRLLGWLPESNSRFRHHRGNPLPHDVVVVDEASMVSVTLMARLLEALRPTARLVLVGDPNQLAPVEAGAVLADIVEAPTAEVPALAQGLSTLGLNASPGPVAVLRRNHRSGAAIAGIADAILAGDADAVVALATAGSVELTFTESADGSGLRERVTEQGAAIITAARAGQAETALAALERHRLLCAHRRGPFGVAAWSRRVEDWLTGAVADFDPTGQWYPGRPVLVTQNTADLGLFNGDTGVVIAQGSSLRAVFGRGGRTQEVSPYVLDSVQTIYAMTVHKAQGSQFGEVSLILPDVDSPLLTRELLYTAITRAERRVHLIGSLASLRQAVQNRARRASGLLARL
ncbi:MAG: exodeoxyribonuclease V subunit alpha [Actinobacteria bacterium HGW-Actinobacteria-2]|nr:MAG: exodeoxyribonuclease V subunit alpha [Actinobacteria bacterium HGW-Actinobacteria-2]